MNTSPRHAAPSWTRLAAVLALAAGVALPGHTAGLGLGPGSALWIEGKSNVHDFEARSTSVVVRLTGAPATTAELEAHVRNAGAVGLEVDVPATSLRSAKAALEKNMWKDLRADEFPTIAFRLGEYRLQPGTAPGDTLTLLLRGTLRIAGQERPVELTARAHRTAAGLWVEGRHALRMSEFGIKPRTMMMGTLRVRDAIEVGYRLLLAPTS